MPALRYKNLPQVWLEARQTTPPQGFAGVRQQRGAPPAYFLPADDINQYLNAQSPQDLYRNPSSMPAPTSYPTAAVQYGRAGDPLSSAILLASQNPSAHTLGGFSSLSNFTEGLAPRDVHALPQAIYAHEVGHFMDPRLQSWANNGGYLTRFGLPGNLASQEAPAIHAEQRFWLFRNPRGQLKIQRRLQANQ